MMAIVVWAALFGIKASVHTTQGYALVSAVIIMMATAIRQLNAVQRWLNLPKSRREKFTEGIVQATLADICRGRAVTDTLLELRVHVWEIPLWYRRLFPYKYRVMFKRTTKIKFSKIAKIAIRPALRRVAAIGLQKQAPTGVRFRKGEGLVGVCVANNDRSEILFVDVSRLEYREALGLADEESWSHKGTDITHNLSLDDARRLSKSYGHVIAKVIQDVESGEPIGCVTISLKESNGASREILDNEDVRRKLANCTLLTANSLA
jgi:hypothetical protein